MDKKNKKILYWLIGIVVVLVILNLYNSNNINFGKTQSIYTEKGIMGFNADLQIKSVTKNPKNLEAIYFASSKTTFQPGARDTVELDTMVGGCDLPESQINEDADVIFTLTGPNNYFDTYKYTGVALPCSHEQYDWTITMPSTTGTYTVNAKVISKAGTTLATDTLGFSIATTTTKCASDYCSDWATQGSITNGKYQTRTCYTYGTAPTCKLTWKISDRYVCDTGFILDSSGINCIAKQVTPTPNPTCPSTCSAFGCVGTTTTCASCPTSCANGCVAGTTNCNPKIPSNVCSPACTADQDCVSGACVAKVNCPTTCTNGCVAGTTTCTEVCPSTCAYGCASGTSTCNSAPVVTCPSTCTYGCVSGTTTCNAAPSTTPKAGDACTSDYSVANIVTLKCTSGVYVTPVHWVAPPMLDTTTLIMISIAIVITVILVYKYIKRGM